MSESPDIGRHLRDMPELQAVLDDLNVKWVTIAANGHWSYEKLGRTRHVSEPLDRDTIRAVAEVVPQGRHARSGEWAVRKYEGVQGAAILIERLPVAVADRLPQQVLATLKKQVRQTGNGVLVGQPGAGKGALLLWLALQIPDEPVLYVSENPPSDFPGNHIMHVFPPSTAQERRALERFVRLTPTVMWDRVANARDLRTLFGFPGARRRWFTLDSSSVRSALRMLTAATQNGCDARFSALLALDSSVIGRPEARNMVVRDDGVWDEVYCEGESCLGILEAYGTSDIRRLSPTEVSVPSILLEDYPPAEIEADEPAAAEPAAAEETAAAEPAADRATDEGGLEEVTDPDAAAAKAGDPHTVPVDVDISEADYDPDEAITGMLPREEVRELREQQMREAGDDEGEMARSIKDATGERDVPEVTKHYVDMPNEIAERIAAEEQDRGEKDEQAEYLNRVMPGLGLDESSGSGPVPAVNIDDLRITSIETVDEADLDVVEDIDDPYDSLDDDSDYSGVFDGDLDFDSLAEDMLSEISEADVIEVDVDSEGVNPAFAATNPEHRIILSDDDIEAVEQDLDDMPTRTASSEVVAIAARRVAEEAEKEPDQGDSTKEFTLDEKLLALRRRRQNDD